MLSAYHYTYSQNINVEIELIDSSINDLDHKVIKKNAVGFTELEDIVNISLDSLKKQGYLSAKVKKTTKKDNFNYKRSIELNQKFNNIYIY